MIALHDKISFLPDFVIDVLGMVAITLLILILIWPDSERFMKFVALTVALIVLILTIQGQSFLGYTIGD